MDPLIKAENLNNHISHQESEFKWVLVNTQK